VIAFGDKQLAVVDGASFADIGIAVAEPVGGAAFAVATTVPGTWESAEAGDDMADSDYEDEVEEVLLLHSLEPMCDDCCHQHHYCYRYHCY
jgi:hypothetical protein